MKAQVAGNVMRLALMWTAPFVAAASTPWTWVASMSDSWDVPWTNIVVSATVPPIVIVALCLAFPSRRYGDFAVRRLEARAGATPSPRSLNLVDQLGIATGQPAHRVLTLPSPIPNVAAFPGRAVTTVVVTEGAEALVVRDDLEALMATQIVVASDRWVRVATNCQLLATPRSVLLFAPVFLNIVFLPLAFVAFLGHRRSDALRDMVADAAALRATRHPEPLARALYELRPAAPHAARLRVGLPGILVDQYWVLSRRFRMTKSVTVGGGPTRTWTTGDEIAAEMAIRSDRVLRGSRGDLDAMFDFGAWRRAVRGLGTSDTSPAGLSIPLTPSELEAAARIEAALG